MSPSKRYTAPKTPSQSRTALWAIASKTGCTFVGELLRTERISLVAVCCFSASVSWRLRSCSSLNNLKFSMAITAWSAKVFRRAICFSVNGRTSVRRIMIPPMATPSRNKGVASTLRAPIRSRLAWDSGNSIPAAEYISSTWIESRSIIAFDRYRTTLYW